VYPKTQAIREGQNAEFFCESGAVWKFNQSDLPRNAVGQRSQFGRFAYALKIHRASKNNSGAYQCTGRHKYYLEFEAEVKLTILNSMGMSSSMLLR